MVIDGKIEKLLSDKEQVDLKAAYKRLHPLMKSADSERGNLRQMHVEKKIAIATDAHCLAALKTNQNGEAKDYPLVKRHRTDAIRRNGDSETLCNVCTHSTDHSAEIKPVASAENSSQFPEISKIFPETDEKLSIKINRELLTQIMEVVSGDEAGVVLSFVRKDNSDSPDSIERMAPVEVRGNNGVGLVMPLRFDNN